MIYIAFTLGLFGSLHCLGMCGPLAFALLPGIKEKSSRNLFRTLGYNSGRVISYTLLGLLMGLIGGFINISGFQKPMSVFMGLVLILLFFMSMDIESILFKSSSYRDVFAKYRTFLSSTVAKFSANNSLLMGMLNGFIPCGLVYLALAGAMTSGGVFKGAYFMFFFGLGTFPAMFALLSSYSFLGLNQRRKMKHFFSYLQLFVGVFLIYRGLAIDIPANLELLWSMGKVMCH